MKACIESPDSGSPLSIFAYGSLIWRPDFHYIQATQVVAYGYERRFWQASHDHRGTPARPGRVLTLVPMQGGCCEGVIFTLAADGREDILTALDQREQDGYERTWLEVEQVGSGQKRTALTWMAACGNPSWVGEDSLENIARLVATRRGPSGSNRDYLLHLHKALIAMGIDDAHIEQLVAAVEVMN